MMKRFPTTASRKITRNTVKIKICSPQVSENPRRRNLVTKVWLDISCLGDTVEERTRRTGNRCRKRQGSVQRVPDDLNTMIRLYTVIVIQTFDAQRFLPPSSVQDIFTLVERLPLLERFSELFAIQKASLLLLFKLLHLLPILLQLW